MRKSWVSWKRRIKSWLRILRLSQGLRGILKRFKPPLAKVTHFLFPITQIKQPIEESSQKENDPNFIYKIEQKNPFNIVDLKRSNIFDPQFDDKRSVFTFRWYAKPPQYGILEKDFFYEETLGRKGTLNKYTLEKGYREDVSLKYPEKYEEMKNLARGFYQTSRFMLFNNKRKRTE